MEFVLIRSAREALPWLMPCDVTDFIKLYPSLRHDKVFVIMVALLLEPRATASFVEKASRLRPVYGADDLAAVLLETLDDMRSPTEAHGKQIQGLNRLGAGEFAGVAAMCQAWGLIKPVPAEGQEESEQGVLPPRKRRRIQTKRPERPSSPSRRAQEEEEAKAVDQWYLGQKSRPYRRTGVHRPLGELLQASRDFRDPPEIVDTTTFLEMVSWAEEFDQFLGRQSRTWARSVGFIHNFFRRKFVLGQLSSSSGRANVRWSEVSVENLKQMSPDLCDYLSRVPAKWNAADLSRFCTDHDDCGIFVLMWACSWGAVVKAKAYQCHCRRGRDALIALVASNEFRDAAREHVQRYGAAAHMLMLVQQFGLVATWPKKKELAGGIGYVPSPRRTATRARPRRACSSYLCRVWSESG